MDAAGIVTAVISVIALLLGIANYVRAREERALANEMEAEKLIDEAYEMLAREPGGTFSWRDLNHRSDVRVLIERAATIAPSSLTTIRWKGLVHQADGNEEKAKECFELLLRSPDHSRLGYMDLAIMREGDEQIPYFEAAAKADPGRSAAPLCEIGRVHQAAGRVEQAFEYAQRSLEANDGYAPAHDLMADVRGRQGELAKAKVHYERAIELDRGYIRPMVGLGTLLTEEDGDKSWDDGLAWIAHAMRTKPRDDYPHVMLSAIHADRQEPGPSLEHYERAVELNPARKLESNESYEIVAEMRKLLDSGSRSGKSAS